jgi:uncharacterized cupredoxin-like copper-binding protein
MQHALPALAMAAAVVASGAMAHGDERHAAAPKKFDASKVEDTAFGREGDPKKVTRTIRVAMADTMRFTPAAITVKRGQTVRLVATNKGQVLHEMVLGTPEELKKHAELMKKFPDMEHEEAHMTHVKPGKTGEIVWQFSQPGEFQFACLIPGHFEAGMVGKVTVADRGASAAATAAPMIDGEVRKIDKPAGKLTLHHGPIPNLEMPGMTMVFHVANPKLLEGLKEGDKVRFAAARVNGSITVTRIEMSK